jgi:hypothetical protein
VVKDFVPGIAAVVRGLLQAAVAVVEILAVVAGKAFDVVVAAVESMLAVGRTVGEIVVAVITDPANLGPQVLAALRDLGNTWGDIWDEALTLSEEERRRLAAAMQRAGAGLQEVLDGLLEAAGGAFFALVSVVLEVFGVFRGLNATERAVGERIYEDTLPWDDIQVFEGSYVSWAAAQNTGGPTGVVTMRIIHFPESYDPALADDQAWLVHELMHVWQGQQTGPVYMAHALIGQGGAGYDYGGDPALVANAGTGLAAFNPEQQGDIMRDYHRRLVAAGDTTPFDAYVTEVRAAA